MTNRISILEPNLYLVGLYIQENALKGYRLVEGYPMLFGYQYETAMEKVEKPTVPQEAAEVAAQRKPGRPVKGF